MTWLNLLAAFLTLAYLPIPFYWLVLHHFTHVWRGRHRAALWTAVVVPWGIGGLFVWTFAGQFFAAQSKPVWAIAAGILLVGLDFIILHRVHREMGTERLVGHAELTGTGELNTKGLYSLVRHPRYSAMLAGMLGVCLMAGTRLLWFTVAVWWLVVLLSIWLEERELVRRFGETYVRYRARVPAFLPIRLRPRDE